MTPKILKNRCQERHKTGSPDPCRGPASPRGRWRADYLQEAGQTALGLEPAHDEYRDLAENRWVYPLTVRLVPSRLPLSSQNTGSWTCTFQKVEEISLGDLTILRKRDLENKPYLFGKVLCEHKNIPRIKQQRQNFRSHNNNLLNMYPIYRIFLLKSSKCPYHNPQPFYWLCNSDAFRFN